MSSVDSTMSNTSTFFKTPVTFTVFYLKLKKKKNRPPIWIMYSSCERRASKSWDGDPSNNKRRDVSVPTPITVFFFFAFWLYGCDQSIYCEKKKPSLDLCHPLQMQINSVIQYTRWYPQIVVYIYDNGRPRRRVMKNERTSKTKIERYLVKKRKK